MMLGVMGVLLLGAASPVMADDGPAPCHEMAGMTGMAHGAPASTPDWPMKSMACCVACVAAPSLTPPVRSAVTLPRARPVALDRALPTGLRTSPETGPPKA